MTVQVPLSPSAVSEREELVALVEAFARTPRMANLLQFLGERYLTGRIDEISEYNIATEVFGRSKTSFDCTSDSIARVEVHRLRKRLKEYYQTEGKHHTIQITIPQRSYVPEFRQHPVPTPLVGTDAPPHTLVEPEDLLSARVESDADTQGNEQVQLSTARSPHLPLASQRRFGYAAAVALLAVLAVATVGYFMRNRFAISAGTTTASSPAGNQQPTPANAAEAPIRLLCGYDGAPRIDSTGAYWQADRYFIGGASFRRSDAPLARTSDPMLFDFWREGDFNYKIPLAPGTYELHLFFAASPPDDFNTQGFDVSANNRVLLHEFNISEDALGTNIADERVFKDVHPAADGYLYLKFANNKSAAVLSALEILPGIPHKQRPIRLVMQSAAVKDRDGNLWHADDYVQGGTILDEPRQVGGTPDPELFSQERYGHFTYSIPVDSTGRYTVVLYFAEHYWMPGPDGSGVVGKRVFRVFSDGTMLLDNLDIAKEVGSLHALMKTFYHLRPSPEGKLNLTFDPIANYATVSAIEVIDESE